MRVICGIKGLVSEERNRDVKEMTETLYYRGFDEEGMYFGDGVSMGVRRLSIADRETGPRPIYNEDRSMAVVSNGEIYNFQRLKNELSRRGHDFYTSSDTEVLVHLWEEYGPDCVKHVKGMFSFAIWDKKEKILFLARDRFGIKPLYYFYDGTTFVFSSELKALFKAPFIKKEIDMRAVSLYFSLDYIPAPFTVFKNIRKLRPAHYILLREDTFEDVRYWDLKDVPQNKIISGAEIKDRFSYLMDVSMREHLTNDVPLGIFLSGGIDSSAMVAYADKFSAGKVTTFSMGFEEKTFDESKFAGIVARRFNTDHHHRVFTKDDFVKTFFDAGKLVDEPFADLSIFPAYMLSKFAHDYVKVALSGEGADEMFMGYPTYLAHRYARVFDMFPPLLRKIVETMAGALPTSYKYLSLDFKLKKFMEGIEERDPVIRHLTWMGAFSTDEKKRLFRECPEENMPGGSYRVDSFVEEFLGGSRKGELCKLIQYIDISIYLPGDLLVKTDRAGMLSSLEIRVPYLDHELVEFAWSLSGSELFRKKLLKKVMKGVLPREIISREKKGFSIPFSLWLMDEKVLLVVKEFFSESFVRKQGIFNSRYLNALLDEHLSGKKDNRKKLRAYIMFQCWYRHFF
ncbi:MAG: asparagine synthase (glutamine-hydrolyzing) [Candidatus Omnitrophota bacterium]